MHKLLRQYKTIGLLLGSLVLSNQVFAHTCPQPGEEINDSYTWVKYNSKHPDKVTTLVGLPDFAGVIIAGLGKGQPICSYRGPAGLLQITPNQLLSCEPRAGNWLNQNSSPNCGVKSSEGWNSCQFSC